MNKKMAIDAETNGLWGNAFCIGAQIWEDGNKISEIALRLPDTFVTNNWVKENVLPELINFPITHNNYKEMLADFATWYLENKEDTIVLWHMGHVVEAWLFREMVTLGLIGEFEAPYCPIEVSETLRLYGYAPDSVDTYAKDYNITAEYASTHNPLYYAEIAFKVWEDIVK